MIDFTRSIVDAMHRCYGDGYIVEPEFDQDPSDIYTETHFALANLLLYLLADRDPHRLETARTHLELYGKRSRETPFNNFAVNLTLALFRLHGVDHPALESLLEELSRRQTLDRFKVEDTPCGNNMYFMQAANDLVIRPAAMGLEAEDQAVEELASELERFRNRDGLYFDKPRSGTGERYCPLTYCLKFLFLISVCHALKPHDRLRTLFLQGVHAAAGIMTRDGDLSYFGRSDNTVFATGLAVFVLRTAAHLDELSAAQFTELCRMQEERLKSTPRMKGGWLSVNRCEPARIWSRDFYAYPTEYSATSACYVLLSLLLTREPVEKVHLEPSSGTWAEETGLVRLKHSGYEVICRTRSQPGALDRRYLGPTVLRVDKGDELLVGTVPMLCSADFLVRSAYYSRPRKLLDRLLHGYSTGTEPFNAHLAGYVPVLIDGPHLHFPVTLLTLRREDRGFTARYAMDRYLVRGARASLHLVKSLLLVNLMPGYMEAPLVRYDSDTCRLRRKAELGPGGFVLEDEIEGPLKGKRIVIGIRRFPSAKADVEGLDPLQVLNAWGSDGRSTLDLHGIRCNGDRISYRIVLSG